MAKVSFETGAIPSIKGAIESLEETKATLVKGAQGSQEVAQESNVGKLIKSAASMSDATASLVKTIDENIECFEKLLKYYVSLEAELA